MKNFYPDFNFIQYVDFSIINAIKTPCKEMKNTDPNRGHVIGGDRELFPSEVNQSVLLLFER